MDRNIRSTYMSSGPRSLPHITTSSSKRHSSTRLSPPGQPLPVPTPHNPHTSHTTAHDDLIHYIYDSWNKVTRDLERGGEEARYYQESAPPRHLANFRPFNLEDWWARRVVQRKHRS